MARFSCLYRRQNGRKNKVWEFDGYLRHYNGVGVLLDENNDVVTRFKLLDFDPQTYAKKEISRNGYDIILEDVEERVETPLKPVTVQRRAFKSPLIKTKPKPVSKPPIIITSNTPNTSNASNAPQQTALRPESPQQIERLPVELMVKPAAIKKRVSKPKSIITDNSFTLPMPPTELFPNESFKTITVDPSLASKLRDHQKVGLEFLYTRLMGYFKGITGAILADDMGMGKTLQTIAVIWTLLNQSPFGHVSKTINKVLICCPVSLVNNWKNEFPKWLGLNRCPVLAINGSKFQDEKQCIKLFGQSDYNKVLIIGYEKMVSLLDDISKVHFDLLVCDEGHRLKSNGNKTLKALETLNIKKRILLSGTPIQNDLNEFHTLVNFAVPNILGDFKSFQKEYMIPIIKSRDSNCTNKNICDLGKLKSQELINKTKAFILRRDNKELNKYLPARTDYILMIQPSLLQLEIFKTILLTDKFQTMLTLAEEKQNSLTSDSLSLINTFRKLCNSPSLLQDDNLFLDLVSKSGDSADEIDFRNQISKKIKSGKMMVLIKLINEIIDSTDDKVVIVSNFTSTLDIISTILNGFDLPHLRLDGSTPPNDRQALVNKFNKTNSKSSFAFLLSAKAGGVGLNLIGANRLIMFDNDWNPAVDNQALARIHRDGQTKPVFVYRLITKGCIDEKILQRQVVKQDLADKFVDDKGGQKEVFDRDALLNVFQIQGINGEEPVKQVIDVCQTHDMMGCKCDGDGRLIEVDENEFDGFEPTEEETGAVKSFVSAFAYSKEDYKEIEARREASKQRKMMRCFKGFRHMFASNKNFETNDSILNKIICKQKDDKVLISWIFGKY